MGTVVTDAYADTFGVEKDVEGVKGGATAAVGDARGVDEAREDFFEAGCIGGCVAGVDVDVGW